VWLYAEAMEPMAALEIASLHGAIFLGMEDDIGSLRQGKLADLMILNGNPLDDIRKTADIAYVMKAGTLYDAMSLDEIWPRARKFGDTPWRVPEMYRSDSRPLDVWDRR
jgi:cytosine/adenosine deaminase-related metal-dependent hydrolase